MDPPDKSFRSPDDWITPTDQQNSLWERSKSRDTSLLAKLNDLTEDEWEELKRHLIKHARQALQAHGMAMVRIADIRALLRPIEDGLSEYGRAYYRGYNSAVDDILVVVGKSKDPGEESGGTTG